MRRITRLLLALALIVALTACQSRPKSVVLFRDAGNVPEVRDLCGLGITSVGVYPKDVTGPVEDSDALWGVRAKSGSGRATRIALFGNVDGYERFGRSMVISVDTNYYVLVDNSSQFYDAQSLPAGKIAWSGKEYDASDASRLIEEMEAQDPALKGKCG